jgi:hypothetical protein
MAEAKRNFMIKDGESTETMKRALGFEVGCARAASTKNGPAAEGAFEVKS